MQLPAVKCGAEEDWGATQSMTDWSDEKTDDALYAGRRNFYKVEKWSGDGVRVMLLLYAGNNLDTRAVSSRRPTSTGRASGRGSASACGC
jgi:hypothetical protein